MRFKCNIIILFFNVQSNFFFVNLFFLSLSISIYLSLHLWFGPCGSLACKIQWWSNNEWTRIFLKFRNDKHMRAVQTSQTQTLTAYTIVYCCTRTWHGSSSEWISTQCYPTHIYFIFLHYLIAFTLIRRSENDLSFDWCTHFYIALSFVLWKVI